MRSLFASAALSGLLLATLPAFGSTHAAQHASHHRNALRRVLEHGHHSRHAAQHHAIHIPSMDAARATQIQSALIHSGYMSGEPTGSWDAQSVAAMQKLQADNGWQTRITPDSRALIKLGLGPQQDQ